MELKNKNYIVFGGDLYIKGENPLIDPEIISLFKESRASFLNLEAPFEKDSRPISKAGPAIKQSMGSIEVLKNLSVTHVSGANNHIADFGINGLAETYRVLKEIGIDFGGFGKNYKEASFPILISELNLAVICAGEEEFGVATDKKPGMRSIYDENLLQEIRSLKSDGYLVVLYAHGGGEKVPLPTRYIRNRYKEAIEAGARAVIAHHPHVIQGYEKHQDGYIFYSIGNFIHDSYERSAGLLIAFDLNLESFKLFPISFGDRHLKMVPHEKDFEKNIEELSEPFKDSRSFDSILQEQSLYMYESYYRSYFTGLFKENLPVTIRAYKILKRALNIPEKNPKKDDLDELMLFHLLRNRSHHESIITALGILRGEIDDNRDGPSNQKFNKLLKIQNDLS